MNIFSIFSSVELQFGFVLTANIEKMDEGNGNQNGFAEKITNGVALVLLFSLKLFRVHLKNSSS